LTTAGQHEFASGVKLEDFSAIYETEFIPKVTEELIFKGRSHRSFCNLS
jgi:beta-glucosidase